MRLGIFAICVVLVVGCNEDGDLTRPPQTQPASQPATAPVAFDAKKFIQFFSLSLKLQGHEARVNDWVSIGLVTGMDAETGRVVIDHQRWAVLSQVKGARGVVLDHVGKYCRDQGAKEVTLYNSESGQSVGMTHEDGEVVVFR